MNKRIKEYRALPCNAKGLEEEKAELLSKMNSILDKAKAETRALSSDEEKEFESLAEQIRQINIKLKELEEKFKTPNDESTNETRIIKDVIYPNEKLEKRAYKDNNLDLGKLIKGMSGLGWNNANKEREYYRTMESGANKVVIPQQLADRIIDYARENSALFGKVPLVSMPHNNLTIAVQTKDGEAKFVKEGDLIPETDIAFKPVTLEGKTLALFVPISEQLLMSASNLSNQITTSCARAIAIALDKALLYGEGVVKEEETITKAEIKGITRYEDINKVSCDKADYDLIIKGAQPIKKANLIPTDVCLNSDLSSQLEMLKTTDGQYVIPPKAIENYDITQSNNINDNESIVFDKNSLLLGIHQDMTIEWGTSGDMFQRIQKGLRIIIRADLGVTNEKGVTLVTVTQ